MTSTLNHLIAGVVLHVIQLVRHEQILRRHLVAANQQSLENKEADASWTRGKRASSRLFLFLFRFFPSPFCGPQWTFTAVFWKVFWLTGAKRNKRRDGSRSIWVNSTHAQDEGNWGILNLQNGDWNFATLYQPPLYSSRLDEPVRLAPWTLIGTSRFNVRVYFDRLLIHFRTARNVQP